MRETSFDKLSDELINMVFAYLLVSTEPLEITYSFRPGFRLSVGQGCALLRVSKRFHRIAEYMLYHYNTFEFRYCSFWLYDFQFEIGHNARQIVSSLRIQWPDEFAEFQLCLQSLRRLENLTLLVIVDLPRIVPEAQLRSLDNLSIREIRVQSRNDGQ